MNSKQLIQAIEECDAGSLHFSNGEELHCFLYQNKWYPLKRVLERVMELDGVQNGKSTTRNALYDLSQILDYVHVRKIKVEDHQLINLNRQEKLEHINILAKIIDSLSQ